MLEFIYIATFVILLVTAVVVVIRRKYKLLYMAILGLLFHLLGYYGPKVSHAIYTGADGISTHPSRETAVDSIMVCSELLAVVFILALLCSIGYKVYKKLFKQRA